MPPSAPLIETSPLMQPRRRPPRRGSAAARRKLPERPREAVTTLATWPVRPEMFSVAPSTISIRATLAALIRPQLGEDVGRLAREALAVDQHVAGRLAEAAPLGVAVVDREAGHLVQHVERVARREAGEVGGRVAARRPAARRRVGRDRRRRRPPARRRRRAVGLGEARRRPSRAGRAASSGGRDAPRSSRDIGSSPLRPPSPAAVAALRCYICSIKMTGQPERAA